MIETALGRIAFSIAGVIIGEILCEIWRTYFWGIASLDMTIKSIRTKKDSSPLRVLEHYHHGLLCLILSKLACYPLREILFGISLSLLLDEILQDNPFAIGKDHFYQSTIIGAILVLVFLWIYLAL